MRARVALCGLLALPVPSAADPPGILSPAYQAVVRRYASGDREGAVAELSAWPDWRIRREVPILNHEWQRSHRRAAALSPELWGDIPMTAALMLHTDCARRAHSEGKPARPHETAAWSIARTLTRDPTRRVFARRWYEAYAELAQADHRWGEALDWAQRGLEDFPSSAELLLVAGSIEEMEGLQAALAAPPSSQEDSVDPSARRSHSELLQRSEVRGYLEQARRSLRAAITADPTRAEGYLRLGRVAWRLGETAEARIALQAALARSAGDRTTFLAHLFLGRLDEEAGHLDEAVASYEAALALEPRCQSARLALSHARLRSGAAVAARLEVEEALKWGGQRPQHDAFWL